MLILKRIVHNTIWGGSKISRYTGVDGDSIGHLYSVYCREGISNEILNGECTGQFAHNPEPLEKNLQGIMDKMRQGGFDLGVVVDPALQGRVWTFAV